MSYAAVKTQETITDSRGEKRATDDSSDVEPCCKGHTLSDRVYGDIIDRIINLDFAEGERLPSEEQLASRYGVSRPIVREALARATHNPFFSDTLLSLEAAITYGQNLARGLGLRCPEHHVPEVQQEHRDIHDSILAGADERASQCMQRHLRNSRRRVFEG